MLILVTVLSKCTVGRLFGLLGAPFVFVGHDENLRAWFERHTNDELRAYLAGEVLVPVERDLPTGRVPHAVAD